MKTEKRSALLLGYLSFTYLAKFVPIPEAPIYGGFVTTTSYFSPRFFATLTSFLNCFCVSSLPTLSNEICPVVPKSSTNFSNTSQSHTSTFKMEPYSLASLNVSNNPSICITARFLSISLKCVPKNCR